jgi:lipopolysaccharide/colanic/teichoic acid biosynthesis glycosyltransferase
MYRILLKPALDFSLALILALLTFPLLILASLLICLETRGSPIFLQRRIGKGLKPFTMFKLRTMLRNASNQGPETTLPGDPRITRIGRILRRCSLDELPQLWNVLLFQMSLIGPRPAPGSLEKEYLPEAWNLRHQVRPGITGLAQASLRSDATMQELMELDSRYVRELSFQLDCEILARTIAMVLSGKASN